MSELLLLVALSAGRPILDEAVTADTQRTAATFPGAFAANPVDHWRISLPGGVRTSAAAAENAQPVLHEGRIYVGSSAGSALYVLDRRDGALLQELEAVAPVQGAPTIQGDVVLFSDTGGHTWCYGLDGALRWKHDAQAPILGSPAVAGGAVYVATVDDLVVALDLADGRLRWRYQHRVDPTRKLELSLYAAPSPVPSGDEVITGFADGAVVGLSQTTGDPRWSARVGEGRYPDIVAPPLSGFRDLVFVSAYFDPLMALDVETHRPRWVLDVGSAAESVLVDDADHDGPPILYHPGTDGQLRRLDPATGDLRWAWASGGDGALTRPVPVAAGVLVGSTTGGLWLVDAETGLTKWTFNPPYVLEGLAAAPSVDGRQVVFTTHAGNLFSLVSPRGAAPWTDGMPWRHDGRPRHASTIQALRGSRAAGATTSTAPSPRTDAGRPADPVRADRDVPEPTSVDPSAAPGQDAAPAGGDDAAPEAAASTGTPEAAGPDAAGPDTQPGSGTPGDAGAQETDAAPVP